MYVLGSCCGYSPDQGASSLSDIARDGTVQIQDEPQTLLMAAGGEQEW